MWVTVLRRPHATIASKDQIQVDIKVLQSTQSIDNLAVPVEIGKKNSERFQLVENSGGESPGCFPESVENVGVVLDQPET